MTMVLVAGALANKYQNGGGTWERMSWVEGFRRLGCDVYFCEQIALNSCFDTAGNHVSLEESVNLAWFRSVTEWFGVADHASLICEGSRQCAGMPWTKLVEVAAASDLLVNLSGHLRLPELIERIRRKAYIDVDPGFTQFWHADFGTSFEIPCHDFYFTIGENVGSPGCDIPTSGIRWRPIRQPVVLEQWPIAALERSPTAACRRFTTVASWRGPFGPIEYNGTKYGLKVHEFRKFLNLPHLVPASFEIALDICPADDGDRRQLEKSGWRIVDPRRVAGDPLSFRSYVQASCAEFSVAQGIYSQTNCGWFSERSIRYLASGKPVLIQDTGLKGIYPVGTGLLTFQTLAEAVNGAKSILSDYSAHCQAAREIAQRYFDSQVVLGRMLQEVGL